MLISVCTVKCFRSAPPLGRLRRPRLGRFRSSLSELALELSLRLSTTSVTRRIALLGHDFLADDETFLIERDVKLFFQKLLTNGLGLIVGYDGYSFDAEFFMRNG